MVKYSSMESIAFFLCVSVLLVFIHPVILQDNPTQPPHTDGHQNLQQNSKSASKGSEVATDPIGKNEKEPKHKAPPTDLERIPKPPEKSGLRPLLIEPGASVAKTTIASVLNSTSVNTNSNTTSRISADQTSSNSDNSTASSISTDLKNRSSQVENATDNSTSVPSPTSSVEPSSSTTKEMATTTAAPDGATSTTEILPLPTPQALSAMTTLASEEKKTDKDLYIVLGFGAVFVFMTLIVLVVCCIRGACAKLLPPKKKKKKQHDIEMKQTTFSDYDRNGRPRKSF